MGMFMQTFHTISPEEAKKMMDEKPVTILDVREPSEYATACTILTELGYTAVYDFGGIALWPYEIED